MRFHLTKSQIAAHQAVQALLVHINDPCKVYPNEKYGQVENFPNGNAFRSTILDDDCSRVVIDLWKKEWDPEQQPDRRWWRATKARYTPNTNFPHRVLLFKFESVNFESDPFSMLDSGGHEPRELCESRFRYEVVEVTS